MGEVKIIDNAVRLYLQGTSMLVNDSISLGQTIRNRRKELSYTQKYISEITGFSMSFLSDLENGKATCEIGKTLHLLNLLGLNINVEARG